MSAIAQTSATSLRPFILSKGVVELGIKNPVVCVFRNIKVCNEPASAHDKPIAELMKKIQDVGEEYLLKPEIRGYRDLFQAMGYPKVVPAGERVFTSFRDRGFKRFGNIIDAYNIMAVETASGLGMHDAQKFLEGEKPLKIWRAEGTERMIPMFKDKEQKVKKGDLNYGFRDDDETDVVAWLGKRDNDSDAWKVTEKTHSLLFVVLGNANTSEEYNHAVCEKTFEFIKMTCPEATMEMVPIKKEEE